MLSPSFLDSGTCSCSPGYANGDSPRIDEKEILRSYQSENTDLTRLPQASWHELADGFYNQTKNGSVQLVTKAYEVCKNINSEEIDKAMTNVHNTLLLVLGAALHRHEKKLRLHRLKGWSLSPERIIHSCRAHSFSWE